MPMERKQQTEDMQRRVKDLQHQVDELKELVNTLLSVIVGEGDGVQSGTNKVSLLVFFVSSSSFVSRIGLDAQR